MRIKNGFRILAAAMLGSVMLLDAGQLTDPAGYRSDEPIVAGSTEDVGWQ
ncbi:hypothetical protein [Streptomyces sp. IB2014 016-6]|nr:hypothetical protein [Streptomyces sp. IB2014 016-6]